jgi:hypothetical protein
MSNARTWVLLAWALCGAAAFAGPEAEHRDGNKAAMRDAAAARRAVAAAEGVPPVSAAPVKAVAVPDDAPAVLRSGGVAAAAACGRVFSWREDRLSLFPEIEARRAVSDSYFGFFERRIAAVCASGDYAAAVGLAERYVYEWDNVYKVKKSGLRYGLKPR